MQPEREREPGLDCAEGAGESGAAALIPGPRKPPGAKTGAGKGGAGIAGAGKGGGRISRIAFPNRGPRRPRAELHDQMVFLNEATARIGVGLDIGSVAREFAEALVPRLADFASVHVLDSLLGESDPELRLPPPCQAAGSPLRRVAVASRPDEPGLRRAAPEGEVQVMQLGGPARRAMVAGDVVLVDRVDAQLARQLDGSHPSGGLAELVRDRSLLAVPLRVRGRVLGCAVLIAGPGRAFDEVALLTVRQLAAQAGLGVDNSRLYQGLRATADMLGRGMRPASPPALAGVEVAHRYLPGNPALAVGGDWYDAIALPGSRVALVVGDVMGHGIRSASVMGRLRTAVQTLAALDLPPEQVLRHLDDLAQRLGPEHLATCIYAVYDPVSRRCTIANAGHIPPVLVRRDGRGEMLAIPAGAPIGVGGVAFETAQFQTAEGELLVLCTDGLVEMRGKDIGEGIAALTRTAEGADQPVEAVCDAILDGLGEQREDDVALLVARLNGIPAGDVAHWYLEALPTTARQARRLIRETLAQWNLSEHAEVVELLASELIGNAIRYASRPLELRLLKADALLCELRDDDHNLPVLRDAEPSDEHGRGLHLVSRLAHRWGANRTSSGKVVWFEQRLTDPDGGETAHKE